MISLDLWWFHQPIEQSLADDQACAAYIFIPITVICSWGSQVIMSLTYRYLKAGLTLVSSSEESSTWSYLRISFVCTLFALNNYFSTASSVPKSFYSNELVRKKRVILFASDDQLRTGIMIDGNFSLACIPQFDQVFFIQCIPYGCKKLSQHLMASPLLPAV